jgi:pimeloyl-ACP methyl ester carboxylesterase
MTLRDRTSRLAGDARAMATLARWLGPWAGASQPADVVADDDVLDGARPIRVRTYRARGAPRGSYLVAPGLHYAGADDPRMDRFCRVMAAAGHTVVAPFIPDYLALTPTARSIDDFERVFVEHARWVDRPPVVFSISFGSLLALGLAARVDVPRLVVFGGYGDFAATLRYCLTGDGRDPLNQPVVMMNVVPFLDPAPRDPAALVAGWRRYVTLTWGHPELKPPARHHPIARELAATVPRSVRELFLIGVGVLPGAVELVDAALVRCRAVAGELDPTPYLARIETRVDIVHGRDDDVVPWQQAHVLAWGLTAADVRVHITGMVNHTGGATPFGAAGREAMTMARILGILAAR